MVRLIDADELMKTLMHEGLGYQYNRVINAPTVDAVPVEFIKGEIKNNKGFYNSSRRKEYYYCKYGICRCCNVQSCNCEERYSI